MRICSNDLPLSKTPYLIPVEPASGCNSGIAVGHILSRRQGLPIIRNSAKFVVAVISADRVRLFGCAYVSFDLSCWTYADVLEYKKGCGTAPWAAHL